uniref:Uncharacterized protein n=1 Tax=Tanacetum cinerariifolium TaxID=118510 RepID=A0A6L2LN08_TANCI|nr:hypothetical protein [Tanacetum cinerariifolium]
MGEVVAVGEGMTVSLKRVEVNVKYLKENLKPQTWRYANSPVPVRLTAYVYLFGVARLPAPSMGAMDGNTDMIKKLYQSTVTASEVAKISLDSFAQFPDNTNSVCFSKYMSQSHTAKACSLFEPAIEPTVVHELCKNSALVVFCSSKTR